jgi:hypothetical protein
MKMRFLPDKPIEFGFQDQLNLKTFVSVVREAIVQTETPFVYGILGDWGTGKTSALHLLEDQLKNEPVGDHHFVPIWFNAWQYENEANIIYPLLYAIKGQYKQDLNGFDNTKGFGEIFLDVVKTSSLALLDVGLRLSSKYLVGEVVKLEDLQKQLAEVEKHKDSVESILSDWADDVGKLNQVFEKLIQQYALELSIARGWKKQNIRFVVIIDDLDRCLPQTTIAVLESIKNFLSVPNCIYILGLNPKVVYQGIRVKYQGLNIDGREYLEKIVNYCFYVPEPLLENMRSYAVQSLEKLTPDDKEKLKDYFITFGQVLEVCCFNNPRKVNRILNHYLRFIHTYETELHLFYIDNVIKLCILGEYFPGVFTSLISDEARKDLSKITSQDFKITNFENKYGTQIQGSFDQLLKMHKLLEFSTSADLTKKHPFSKHWTAVSTITRLS